MINCKGGRCSLKKGIHKKVTEGTITVYLTLILLLILSLLFTIIEGARVSTAKVYAERALTTAMDSVLAEYYGPLWEDYHIFGLNIGEGNNSEQKEQITTKLMDYMSYTFKPNKSKLKLKEGSELYDISLASIAVNSETMLMDYQGQLLINEAVEYMKYNEIGNGLELLLDKISLLETPKKVSAIYKEKEEVEEELVEIDEGILELMELLDGIKTSKKGIELGKDGGLKTTEYFAKKFCFEEVTKESVAINQESVFQALKDSYINPSLEFEAMKSNFVSIERVLLRLKEIKVAQGENATALSDLQEQLDVLNTIENKSKDVKQQIKSIKGSLNNLNEDSHELQQEIYEQEAMKRQITAAINTSKDNLSQLIYEIIPLLDDAIRIADNLVYKTDIAVPLVEEYEETLYKAKESLGEEVFAGLEEDLKGLKRYTSLDLSGYNFIDMLDILEYNRIILLFDVGPALNKGETELAQENYQASKTTFTEAENKFMRYEIKDLAIDYSTLVLDKSKQKDPLGEVENILQAGIMDLVIEPNKLSKAELTEERIPSAIAAMAKDDTNFLSELTSFFEDTLLGSKNSGISNLFYSFENTDQIMSMAGYGINKAAEHFLFQEYLKEHFAMFPNEEGNLKVRKPSALSYEQEYLLIGKMSDQENLSAVISKIIFSRTILDFVSLLGDKAKCNEAKMVATSLVGFTGLPILICITTTIILLIWSFVEALVDVCALLMGKEVPVLKKKVVTGFSDLFLINRGNIQSKASQIVTGKELALTYQDYLRGFLLIKNKEDLAYRSMDLMQENINLRYVDTFYMDKCLFGYQVKADYTIKSKFTGFSFMQIYLDHSVSGFHFSVEAAYSY
jgi:methyl-accepting chemotaxis protein